VIDMHQHIAAGGRSASTEPSADSRPAPAIAREVVRSPGQELDKATQSTMADAFGGRDFSQVRVHTDARAAESADAVHARAYTVGQHIAFGAGQYAPHTPAGSRLLGHELTHTIQKRNPTSRTAGPVLQRDPKPGTPPPDPLMAPLTDREWADIYMWLALGEVGTDPLTENADENANLIASAIFLERYVFSPAASTGDPLLGVHPGITLSDPRTQAIKRHVTSRGPLVYTASANLGGRFPPQIRAYYFPGTTAKRAMIVGGMHGEERAGVQVVELLLDLMRARDPRTGQPRKPAFNVIVIPELFPANVAAARRKTPGQRDPNRQMPATGEVPGARRDAKGRVLSQQNRPIEPENLVLLDLVNHFKPERIAMVHGFRSGRRSSITTDPRPDPAQEKADDALALAMAESAATRGARVPANRLGTAKQTTRFPTSTESHEAGVTFGMYGSRAAGARPAMNVILIETFKNFRIEERRDAERERRRVELTAFATVLREIFLERP
jgi:hypothetical protein